MDSANSEDLLLNHKNLYASFLKYWLTHKSIWKILILISTSNFKSLLIFACNYKAMFTNFVVNSSEFTCEKFSAIFMFIIEISFANSSSSQASSK